MQFYLLGAATLSIRLLRPSKDASKPKKPALKRAVASAEAKAAEADVAPVAKKAKAEPEEGKLPIPEGGCARVIKLSSTMFNPKKVFTYCVNIKKGQRSEGLETKTMLTLSRDACRVHAS